mgnify:CR=1 FL=1
MNIVSRGGSLVFAWMCMTGEENPFYEYYDEILDMKLKVMDLTAITMCRENNMPIYVFDMDTVGNLEKVMNGQQIGTLVKP